MKMEINKFGMAPSVTLTPETQAEEFQLAKVAEELLDSGADVRHHHPLSGPTSITINARIKED